MFAMRNLPAPEVQQPQKRVTRSHKADSQYSNAVDVDVTMLQVPDRCSASALPSLDHDFVAPTTSAASRPRTASMNDSRSDGSIPPRSSRRSTRLNSSHNSSFASTSTLNSSASATNLSMETDIDTSLDESTSSAPVMMFNAIAAQSDDDRFNSAMRPSTRASKVQAPSTAFSAFTFASPALSAAPAQAQASQASGSSTSARANRRRSRTASESTSTQPADGDATVVDGVDEFEFAEEDSLRKHLFQSESSGRKRNRSQLHEVAVDAVDRECFEVPPLDLAPVIDTAIESPAASSLMTPCNADTLLASSQTQTPSSPVLTAIVASTRPQQKWAPWHHEDRAYHVMIKVFKNLRASELNYMARADYISSVQTDINFAMRAILCDWLIEVADEYSLLPATFALCINYVDRFLSVRVVRREKLQLVGIACMLIAAKYEEIFPPTVDDFVYISDNTYCKAEVLEMESQILKALSFSMTVVTPMAYLDHYSSHVADVTEPELFSLAHYVCELNMIEPVYFRYAPSMFAAVCVSVAYHSLHGGVEMFPDDVLLFSGYEAQDMLECFTAVHRVYSANQSKVIKAVFDKFAKTKYHSVSLIPVRAMSPVELS